MTSRLPISKYKVSKHWMPREYTPKIVFFQSGLDSNSGKSLTSAFQSVQRYVDRCVCACVRVCVCMRARVCVRARARVCVCLQTCFYAFTSYPIIQENTETFCTMNVRMFIHVCLCVYMRRCTSCLCASVYKTLILNVYGC